MKLFLLKVSLTIRSSRSSEAKLLLKSGRASSIMRDVYILLTHTMRPQSMRASGQRYPPSAAMRLRYFRDFDRYIG